MSDVSPRKTGYEHDNLRHVVITSTCFAFILSTTAVGFRVISRKLNGQGLFLDDYLIISALLFEYGITIAGIVLLYNGLGKHIVYVKPDQLTVYLKTLFTGSILYTCCIASVKLSILTLYRRIFPTKWMKMSANIVGMVVILWAACGILAGAFTCIPTEKLWNPQIPGGCMNLSKFYYGLQIPNIATDAIILFMPMHVVWALPISNNQKVGLSGIFILGFLTLVFDIVRLVALIDLSTAGDDITYTQVNSSVWTCIEPAVGIVAACLSNMRPLFKIVHTKMWSRTGSSRNTSQQDTLHSNDGKAWPRNTPSPTNTNNTTFDGTTHTESSDQFPLHRLSQNDSTN
ncbi:hypothetical protein N7476_010334 [Penicillium atrosanguineum]|uniref:Rhodopsin domain-containing protein n=1 Tax=Penicillium atrosanguineum TaxID=1132637 RepID=A0A9W9PQ16_9EURO|nr:hypothetical protein N7476_010334 [Penicillium atrosanguineum]